MTIAASSQFVDDNVPRVLEDHAGLSSFFRASGHGLVDNIKDIKYDDFSERDLVGYSSSFILSDPDFCRAFYDALNEYYVWVRAGLEEQGVVWDDFIES